MITVELLRERLDYDPETGVFTHKLRAVTDRHSKTWNTLYSGKQAGALAQHGYILLCVKGIKITGHRAAWMMMTGSEPPRVIDHVNGARSDNRWSNLREATHSLNAGNKRIQSNNSTGLKGVYNARSGKWHSRIKYCGVDHYLGTFETAALAKAAYDAKAVELFGEFARF